VLVLTAASAAVLVVTAAGAATADEFALGGRRMTAADGSPVCRPLGCTAGVRL